MKGMISNLVCEDFRSLFNTSSRENSELIMETTRIVTDEITIQVTITITKD